MTDDRRGLARTFSSLGGRNYRLFFAGQVVSVTGTWMQRVGQDWLILRLTDSAVALSIGVALQFLPVLLLGLWGGVIVDRFDTRRVLLWCQAVMGVLALVLGVLTLAGVVQLWMVYVLALALGCVTVVDQPGRQAFVNELVGPSGVANATSLNSSTNNIARLIGPAVAGLLITAVGVAPAFLVNAASYVAVFAALWALDQRALYREQPVARSPRQVREGLSVAWTTPALRAPLLLVLVLSLFTQNFRVVLPLMASEVFGRGAATYGTLMGMLGLGALAAALACAHYARPSQRLLLVMAAGLGTVCIVAAAAPSLAALMGLMVLVGASHTSFNTTSTALVQLRSPAPVRGRVLSLRVMLTLGSTPVGAPLIGWVCDAFGARTGLAVGGIVALLATAVALPTRHLDTLSPVTGSLPGAQPTGSQPLPGVQPAGSDAASV